MVSFEQILSQQFANNTVQDYIISLGVLIITVIVLFLLKYFLIKKFRKFSEKTKTNIDDTLLKSIENVHMYFYILIGLFLALQFISINEIISKIILYIIIINGSYYIIKLLENLVDHGVGKISKQKQEEKDEHSASIVQILGKAAKVSIWALAFLLLLSNLGYNITSLIAGLGIGGIAIAFALQNVLSDIFASVAIYFDKPFKVGDFIIIGDQMGTVKKIGIKSTRIETLQGEELVVSNRELTETRVRNFRDMKKRRIVFTIGVVYETKTAKLEKINKIIEKIFSKVKDADLSRIHFKEFGSFSLNYEIVYYVKKSDYKVYMDTQQKINLAIKEEFEKENIEMAFPTQTVYLHKN